MAVISKKDDIILLGDLNVKEGRDIIIKKLKNFLEIMDRVFDRKARSRNRKLYNKGVYSIICTCKECSKQFEVRMPTYLYHAIIKLHLVKIESTGKPASNGDIFMIILDRPGISMAMKDTFRTGKVLCPACVSKNKQIAG